MNGRNVKADLGLLHPFIGPELVANSLADIKLYAGKVVSLFSIRAEYTGVF